MRILVVEGNVIETRQRMARERGDTPSQAYAQVLRSIVPEASVDICFPADEGAALPFRDLQGYDGVALTGSAMHIYDMTPAITRQIDLAQAVLASGTPMFGSCWGLQVITTAAGGVVRRNPKGREVGVARRITLNDAGRGHPMYAGKPHVFDALAVHLDEVETMAPGARLLASNDMSQVQAIEITSGRARAWAVQYHPEFTLAEVAAIAQGMGGQLVTEGFFADTTDCARWCDEMRRMDGDAAEHPLTWRHGIDEQVTHPKGRHIELRNWIEALVRPVMTERGRA